MYLESNVSYLVVQQKSLFNDPAAEIDKLTFVIKQDLQTLASELDILEQYVQEHRTGQKQADSHSETVVSTLKSQVANATKDFTKVLQMRSKVCSWHVLIDRT